ncbi:MAG: class I SAM-dependent methyltransferase [Pseudomonadota bacterium]
MSLEDKKKWDTKYAEGAYETRTYPSVFLAENLRAITESLNENGANEPWRALDLACGAGRNAHYLSTHGFTVDAIDISDVGLARAKETAPETSTPINWQRRDLDETQINEFPAYHLIVMFRYVDVKLLTAVTHQLSPGGFVICEEHMQTEAEVVGPQSARFRVAPDELRAALNHLDVLTHEERIITEPNGERAAVARIIAKRP